MSEDNRSRPRGRRALSAEWLGALPRAITSSEKSSLHGLLAAGRPSPSERFEMERALGFPWSWPGNDAVANVPDLAELDAPAPPRPGATCLVSVTPDERVALWALSPSQHEQSRPLVDRASRDALVAMRIATTHLPLVAATRPLRASVRWSVQLAAKVGLGVDRVLDGASFGLGFVLAAASLLLDVPVPVDVCALAAIDEDGRLIPVGGLAEKLWMLAAWAPAVRRVLVSTPQAPRAREIVDDASLDLRVVAVSSVSVALEVVFPDARTEPDLPPGDGAALRGALEDVYRAAVDGAPSMIDWATVARAAARLGEHAAIRSDPRAREEAHVAEALSWRHSGRRAVAVWPSAELLARSPRPVRLRLLAHVVSSLADTQSSDIDRFVDEARGHLAGAGEEHAEDLDLLAAMGRALAAVDRDVDALDVLRRAVDGWFAIWRPDGAAAALSEMLRIHGFRFDPRSVGETVERFVPGVLGHVRTTDVARATVHLAAGRALTSVGAHDDALVMLDAPLDWSQCPSDVQHSRLRWRANALTRAGRREDGHRARRELALRGSGSAFPALSALDLALSLRDDPLPALASLESVAADEIARWHAPGLTPVELARRVALRWRY
ncbi:MAG: hypothetical protein IT379_02120 [Deltaproteobacteria bacterium]|nr:hypothetical protein [Deltaproteobacteria bacterium]